MSPLQISTAGSIFSTPVPLMPIFLPDNIAYDSRTEHPAQLPALPRIPPVADRKPPAFSYLPLVVIPSPSAVWTGARSGLGTPVESAGLQIPEDLLFPTLKSEISDLPFLPFSSAASSDSAPTIQPRTLTPLECAVMQIAPITLLEFALIKKNPGGGSR